MAELPTTARIALAVDRHVNDMCEALERMGATPAQLREMSEPKIAEWYENWINEIGGE